MTPAAAVGASVIATHMPRLVVAGAAVVVASVVALAMFFTLLVSGGTDAVAAGMAGGAQCATTGPLAGVTDAQAQSARTIVATATAIGGPKAAVIAVMVALAESGLTNVDHGDRDSVGLFQQRANWGSPAQRMDPVWATTAFLTSPRLGLLARVPGWAKADPWVAAQVTQASAWDGYTAQARGLPPARDAVTGKIVLPDGYGVGANYEAQYTKAQGILAQVNGDAAKLDCGGIGGTVLPAGDAARRGLPTAYDITTTGANPGEVKAVTFALAQLNKPYVFAAAGPDSFDCSGLTMAAWAKAGVSLPHWTLTQADAGTPVGAPADLSPGDLILVPGSDGTLAAPGHVGMYIGHSLVVDAADEQIGIIVQSYSAFVRIGGGLSGIRHVG